MLKEVIYDGNGKPKGNCDADLVLQAARDTYENKYNKAIIVSSDCETPAAEPEVRTKPHKIRGKVKIRGRVKFR